MHAISGDAAPMAQGFSDPWPRSCWRVSSRIRSSPRWEASTSSRRALSRGTRCPAGTGSDIATSATSRSTICAGWVAIEGHASNDEPGGQALSEARAKAVLARMTAAGIDPKRLVVHGFGSARPVDDNKTNEGRERNRRVEFRIVQEGDPAATGDASCSPGSPSGRSGD